MSASSATARWTRLFVLAGLGWFVCWQAAVVAGVGRPAVVVGLYGFVLHTVFGKAYALVPSYFDRALAFPRAPAVHFPLAVLGTAAVAGEAVGLVPTLWGTTGATLWALGCLVFVGTLVWSVRDNLSGGETGTSDAKADRRRVDRFANAFVPVALGYLLVGSVLSLDVGFGPLPTGGPPVTHLFAAGTAALLVFTLGFRLLPRFLVVTPRWPLVAVVLPAAAAGPLLLATAFGGGRWFHLGAGVQALALLGFAVAYVDMFLRSDRRRIGLYTVVVAAVAAAGVALFGVHMAVEGISSGVAAAHARLALLGFLGLAVVGVQYQFYPPTVASALGVDDRTAGVAVALLAVGVVAEGGGLLVGAEAAVEGGRWLALAGAVAHAVVLLAVFWTRRNRR
ncbi:hypothetical protein GJ631_06585 [Natronomonas sp. CBA1123]|uniref:hypothetical protein n=1 Tax=Natronomonas sp. CBA1123 TaxID=2668070 RepID=UPI0012EA4F6C|nr:hypothetical protein [Natronomonas sp. CBA1123]MUV86246.1 hypothetical protein [Natronomonas sp. CBA1123]